MSLIECKNINRFFGSGENRVHVLKDVSLSIEKGDFVAIIGQSGSGKSTLMNILGCLDTATSGSYQIDGIETSQMQPDELAALRRERFGFIFQRYNLFIFFSPIFNFADACISVGVALLLLCYRRTFSTALDTLFPSKDKDTSTETDTEE